MRAPPSLSRNTIHLNCTRPALCLSHALTRRLAYAVPRGRAHTKDYDMGVNSVSDPQWQAGFQGNYGIYPSLQIPHLSVFGNHDCARCCVCVRACVGSASG